MVFGRQYEVAASTAVNVPSRLPAGYRSRERNEEEGRRRADSG